MKSTFRTGDAGSAVLSPWFIDKRFAESAGGEGLSDFNPSEKVEVWRDIDDVSRGLLGLDFIADIQFGKSGLYFRVTDDGKTPLMSLDTRSTKPSRSRMLPPRGSTSVRTKRAWRMS